MEEVRVNSKHREQMIDITGQVQNIVAESGATDGCCTIFVQHTTCGVTINENADPDVQHDILLFLRNLVPQYYEGFKHFEHNSDAHIKGSLMGSSVTVPVQHGDLALGRWQGIYLCEFDGPKERVALVSIK